MANNIDSQFENLLDMIVGLAKINKTLIAKDKELEKRIKVLEDKINGA